MKSNKILKGILLSGTMIVAGLTHAQNSNPWPTTGAVGIGTSTPSQPLHVLINQPFPANPFPTALKLQNSFGGSPVGLDFLTYGNAAEPSRVARIEAIDRGQFRGALAFYTKGTTLQTDATPTERMRISEVGNVGIGTNSPSAQLHIYKSSGFLNLMVSNAITNLEFAVANQSGWYSSAALTNDAVIRTSRNGSQNSGNLIFAANDNSASCIKFSTGGSNGVGDNERMQIAYNGQVLINKPTSTQIASTGFTNNALFVNGQIGATSVVVSLTNWSDYVFDESYKLPSLEEVETFIKVNKHLPAVPSEKEVVANGVNTGEMLKTHMRKIEELTLYVIELKKEIEALKK